VALLFFVPGIEETLKVFGTTELLAADALDLDLTEFGRQPRSVLLIEVQRAYFQCPKAVMRSGLWDPSRQVPRSVWPPFGEVLKDHCRLPAPLDEAEMRAELATEL
jgi:predicted pyridoxine 5'-phosphate oxidase superfamily flavin-nucleotide-binding protein